MDVGASPPSWLQSSWRSRLRSRHKTPQAPPTVTPGKLAEGQAPPVIDGLVNDAVWETVTPHTTFTQQDPRLGEPATERTEVRLLFGPTAVYVSFVCFDADPSSIIVSQAKRDASLAETEAVIAVFDTFNDNQNAFVFGTNPLGIEYDGQVAREGQTGGQSFAGGGGAGTQRGGISAFNPNWDGDWTVRAQITERGWEAEMAIPLKTLRYAVGEDKTWGFNVMRNIRHKNEQVYLSFIPRGFDIYRISLAAKVPGLNMPQRRDIKIIPYALGSANKDYTRASDQLDRDFQVGIDTKWGVTPSLTLDATVNTDFAQVEADEEQVNLTRFDLFFPEKRPFFLENASTFQFGQPQSVDLFFSRRIGLSGAASSLQPIPIIAGGRLSGKVAGSWNVGLLNIQTNDEQDGGRQPALAGHQLHGAPGPAGSRPIELRRDLRRQVLVRRPDRDDVQRVEPRLRCRRQRAALRGAARVRVLRPHRHARDRRQPGRRARQRLLRSGVLRLPQPGLAGRGRLHTGRRQLQPRGRLPAPAWLPSSRVPRVLPAAAEEHPVDSPVRAAHLEQRLLGPERQPADRLHPHPPVRDPADARRAVRLVRRPEQGQPAGAVRGLQPRRQPRGDSAGRVHLVAERASSTSTTRAPRSPARSAIASATTTMATSTPSS